MKKKTVVFLSIFIIAGFLRVWNLNSVPPSPSLDEVSIGWNAYSISKTGADEYGEKFPLLLRAYDDWRPALYVYLVIPFLKVFGLSTFAVRFPSIVLSLLSVATTYFLIKLLFAKTNDKKNTLVEPLALLTMFLLAISPWHIYLSRLGHEVNAGLAFFLFALTFFFMKKIPMSAV